MLDLNFVRENLPLVEEKLRQRGMDPAAVLKDFREVDTQRRQAITEAETSKAQRNKASEEIARREMFAMVEILAAQRRKLLELRSDGKIDDEIMHRIERDLDEHEMRLQGQEETLGA